MNEKKYDVTEKIEAINFIDPRNKSLSHQLYNDVESGMKKLIKEANTSEDMSVADKTRIYNTFLKYRKEMFQDVHFLIQCIKELPKEGQTMFFVMAEKIKLDNALREKKGLNILS